LWRWRRSFDHDDPRRRRWGRLFDNHDSRRRRWRGLFDNHHLRLARRRWWRVVTRVPFMDHTTGGKCHGRGQSKELKYDFHTLSLLHVSNRGIGALLAGSAAGVRS
jgi:hypothetical protein